MADEPSPDKQPAKRRSLLVLLLAAVFVVICVCGATMYLRSRKAHTPEAKTLTVLHLEPFTVNLADEDGRTYLRIGLDLGVVRPPAKEKGKEVASNEVPVVRDAVLSVLMAMRSEELAGVEGKQKLKESLLQSLTQKAPEVRAQEIYFTEFLIQR